jgi:hypothetical protein
MSKNIVFVSDFFVEEVLGGAELSDSALSSYLEQQKNFKIERIHCRDLTRDFLEQNKEKFFVISNFTTLKKDSQIYLENSNELKYIIVEHDHKYLLTRDPSGFKDFIAPPEMIINRTFYERAKLVVGMSKLHTDIIKKNLPTLKNIFNAGTAFWTAKTIEKIRQINSRIVAKGDHVAIQHSKNPIKGMSETIKYCDEKKLPYLLTGNCSHDKMLEELAKAKSFAFFPQVVESYSMVTMEAKMLGCKILTTPKLLGCASEENIKLNGPELVDDIERRIKAAVDKIADVIENFQPEITVILNCYRRPKYLKEQLEAIRNQSIKPKEVWLWVNKSPENEGMNFSDMGFDKVFNNDFNWKFYGRFAGAMLARTKYIALFDDDTIPGENWFKNCLDTMKTHRGILGGAGVTLNSRIYDNHRRVGWAVQNEKIERTDLVGHAWFFEREWLKYLWQEEVPTWDNGEDIQFSYTAQRYGKIETYCPAHPKNDLTLHSSLKGNQLGIDDKATSNTRNHFEFYPQRDYCIQRACEGGWKTVNNV